MPTATQSTIPALTICQPWAWAIVHGSKRVENRTWPTNYRGPLAIHAGKSRRWLRAGAAILDALGVELPRELAFGAIVGVCRLVDCVPVEQLDGSDPYASGPWCWMLDDVRPLAEPVPWTGQLGLFQVPADRVAA